MTHSPQYSLTFLGLAALTGAVHAGSFIGFETVNTAASTDALALVEQFRPTQGIRFARADGGTVAIAKTGTPFTAFAAGPDGATYSAGDSVLTTDPLATSVGASFLKLAGNPTAALIINYDYATAAAGGVIIDVDANETWAIRGYSDAGTTLVAETVIAGGTKGTGDQTVTPWALTSNTANMVQIRIVQTGANLNSGAALDLFSPYGPLDFSTVGLSLGWNTVNPQTLLLGATPGHRITLQSTGNVSTGPWTPNQTLIPGVPVLSLTDTTTPLPARKFYRAVGPTPAVARSATIFTAVSAFVDTLTAAQKTSIIYPAGDTTQRAKWSNFPTGIYQRNGLNIGSMTTAQKAALWPMLAAVLSPEGYQKIANIVAADDQLGAGGGLTFGTAQYYVSFVGTPSATGKYLLQFGGHHLAINATIKGNLATIAPALPGAQPTSYTLGGRTIRPIGEEYDLSFALLNSLTTAQRSIAVLSSSTRDLALGPGQDGITLLPEGIKASDLTVPQRAILLDLIGKSVNIIHDDASATKLASIRANLADATNATYFSWRGPTTAAAAAYYRIQGPNLFIEWAPQSMGGSATNHIHAMYRELGNDYGALIP